MDIKCRVCLATTEAKMYHSLSTVFPEYMKTSLTVLDLLQVVTSTSVNICDDLPNSICTACLKQLKDSYKFIEQFKNAQMWLLENFNQEFGTQQERIIVKVEAIDEEFSSPTILDMEGNDIHQISSVDEEYKDSKKTVKNARSRTTLKEKKEKSTRKRNGAKPVKKNKDGLIVMSIEDVLKEENDRSENNENINITSAKENDNDEEEIIIHTDHNYQKISEVSNESYDNLCVMSIDDVLASATKLKAAKTSAKRKRAKGIITQSADLLQNLERKTRTRRIQKQTKVKEEGLKFLCYICQNVYESHKSLIAHKYSIHVTGWQEKLKCTICGMLCKTRSSYTHHKRKHKGKQANCDECEKVYLTNTQVKEHKRRVHENGGFPAKFLCNECGRRFKFNSGLQYHLVSVHKQGEKQYMCRYCGFKCFQKSYINRHERCHTDERPYKCKFCERTFRGSAELHTHQLSHEGKTKYNCKYCGRGYIQVWNMKVHWLQHPGDYDCEMCHRNFIDENVLKFHYYHHHKIREDVKKTDEDTNSNGEQENSDSLFFQLTVDPDSSDIF